MKVTITGATTEQFVKRAFFLAWQACGGAVGMGVFQDHGPQDENAVWDRVIGGQDYAVSPSKSEQSPYADYVFGRMMKFGCDFNENGADFYTESFRSDYQGFARKYKRLVDLLDATAKSLGCEYKQNG